MTNRLTSEKSPYLKQHENNPVDWHPWKSETLKLAKDKKKPIFLSVGYASCHWCHVMAHESFEDEETAKIMNERFINIKVDREERPDLDYVFQRSLSILTGTQGGWPLSMFLDENGVPFTGGTYFPPKEMQGRPDFRKVLNNVSDVYKDNREKIIAQASQMQDIFSKINQKSAVLNQPLLPFVDKIISYLDEDHGSFKGAPKFPQFYLFDAMFYFYLKNNDKKYLKPVETLLKNVCSKGIYDQLAGGIARYTVDDKWIVPHFEKMLYDNIQFISLLSKFYQSTRSDYFKNKLIQTIKYINTEFVNEIGLYGSAYDADSEGVEGKFYTWSFDEISKILQNNLNIFAKKYQITKEGNFEGKNILIEQNNNLSEKEKEIIINTEKDLILIRNKRVKPLFDDKSQTDQNAFLITALLNASVVLEDENIKEIAFQKFKILKEKMSDKIFHCYQSEEIDVFLEDYVFYSKLLLNLYEIDEKKEYLDEASKIMDETWGIFYDDKSKLLQKNPIKKNDLFVSPVDLNDNNIPNGNSVYLTQINKLYYITNDKYWSEKSRILQQSFHQILNSNFSQMFSFVKALDMYHETISFTFYGDNKEIKNYLLKNYFDRATFIYYTEDSSHSGVVICKNQTCSKKISSINEINDYLKGISN
ncbi:thioredoxin domain-containing protein [Candidatus Pelagibacter sp.]|nr:thioredoxin domain-containing protein [Candidatus Pelagibacter sp.]